MATSAGAIGAVTGKARWFLSEAGDLFAISLEGFRRSWDLKRWWGEFIEQCWFLAKVTTVPILVISVPIGATVALQVGQIAKQLGAQSATGAVVMLGIIREASPIASALLIAGAGGSAIASDMGSRNIRDELDAMAVLGINPIHRLVTPRLWAGTVISVLLVSFVMIAGITGGFVFNVLLQGVSPGAYFQGGTLLLQVPDLLTSLFKAAIFGAVAAMVACYKGMTCKKGPVGVGRAVNQAVVITFVLVFFINYIITTLYFVLVPQKI